MADDLIYLDGAILPAREARIEPGDQGFLYGASLFETMRVYGGKLFRAADHLARMERSAAVLRFACPDRRELEKAMVAAIEANGVSSGRLRLTLFRGKPPVVSHLMANASAGIPYSDEQRKTGLRATISEIRLDSHSPLAGHKTGNYLPNLLAREMAREQGFDEALLLNHEGLLIEGSASNVFMVSDGRLITPPVSSGILPGITRGVVLESAQELGIEVEQREIALEELKLAGEAFLTNSLMEIMPLVRVDERIIGSGAPGELTCRLAKAYSVPLPYHGGG